MFPIISIPLHLICAEEESNGIPKPLFMTTRTEPKAESLKLIYKVDKHCYDTLNWVWSIVISTHKESLARSNVLRSLPNLKTLQLSRANIYTGLWIWSKQVWTTCAGMLLEIHQCFRPISSENFWTTAGTKSLTVSLKIYCISTEKFSWGLVRTGKHNSPLSTNQ